MRLVVGAGIVSLPARMKFPALQRLWRTPVSPLVCFGLAWLVTRTVVADRFEWRTLDWRTEFRALLQGPPDPRIAIVLFEDSTDLNLTSWPPDRSVHGDMIELLSLAQPAVISWDVILDAVREGDGDAHMAHAAEVARNAGIRVVTAAVSSPDPTDDKAGPGDAGPTEPFHDVTGDISQLVGDRFAFRPFPALRKVSWYGFADTPKGAGGVQREIPLVVRIGHDVWPNLSLQTVMAYYDVPADKVRVRLGDAIYLPTKQRGELRIPIAADGTLLLNYRYDQTDVAAGPDYPTYSYLETLIKLTDKFVDKRPYLVRPRPDFKGKIVFLGQTVTGKADAGPTPRSLMSPLVLVHANLLNNVLADDFARRAPAWPVWLGAVGIGYIGLWLGLKKAVRVGAMFTVITIAVYVVLAFGAWVEWSLWLPFAGPLLGFVALEFIVTGRRVLVEQHGREQVKQMFGTYLSPELLKKMMKGGGGTATVSSERRPVTILFSDLRDFTSLTESVQEDVLIRQLNEYLAAMVECIHHEGGTLHKFIGDAVMAVWGDLESDGAVEDAAGAARAALAMGERLAELNVKWKAEGMPLLRMGIGLNHGTVLIGNIGSPRRMEFTAIGDAVNLASRLEGLNKQLGTTLLVGEGVEELLKDRFEFRACGEVPVKGKAKPVEVFELVRANPTGSPAGN